MRYQWDQSTCAPTSSGAGSRTTLSDRGGRLLRELEQVAAGLGLDKVFVLTTQTAHWFIEQGFEEASPADLPAAKQSLYNLQRNSKVFIKHLGR